MPRLGKRIFEACVSAQLGDDDTVFAATLIGIIDRKPHTFVPDQTRYLAVALVTVAHRNLFGSDMRRKTVIAELAHLGDDQYPVCSRRHRSDANQQSNGCDRKEHDAWHSHLRVELR